MLLAFALACGAPAGPGASSAAAAADAERVPMAPPAPDNRAFWGAWGDGRAEVSSYTLRQPRYGEAWDGTAVLIFVTEPFSWSERVKADPGEHPDADVTQVLKLNATREFQTGIYPYRLFTSVFARVDPGDGMAALAPIKLSHAMTEWCGVVYDEWVPSAADVRMTSHTYFDGDTRPPATVGTPAGVVYADAIPILVRSLRGDWVERGATARFPVWPALHEQRFAHVAPALGSVEVTRGAAEVREVAAGTFTVEPWRVVETRAGGPTVTTTWYVEAEGPRRIIGWESTAGESAWLRGSDRLPYWQLHNPGDESARARVGL